MKSLRNKVILSGIVLVFAFIATIGSTYAWFTVSTSTSVSSMELSVSAADNLLIRPRPWNSVAGDFDSPADIADVSTYSTVLTNQDLIDAGYDLSWGLQPATVIQDGYGTYDAKILNYLDNLDGSTNPDRDLISATRNGATGHYIELQFYLYSQSGANQAVEVTNLAIDAVTGENTTEQNDIELATRLSIFDNGSTEAAQIFGNDTDYGYVFQSGLAGYSTTASTLTTASEPFNQISDLATAPTDLATSVIDIDTYNPESDNGDVVVLTPSTPTLVTVYIYVEGWDAEAVNAIVEAVFTVAFGFKFGTIDA